MTLRLSIVQIFSAADAYVDDLEADRARWADFRNVPSNYAHRENEGQFDRLEKVCRKHGWQLDPASDLSPLLRFFRLLASCVAHRRSIASEALAACAVAEQTVAAIKRLEQTQLFGMLPLIPRVQAEALISLEPEHQFFCLAIVGHSIRCIDKQFRNWLGEDGVVYLAAYHTLLIDSPSVATDAYRDAAKVINHALSSRYNVQAIDKGEVSPILSQLGVWQKYVKRHATHYAE